MRVLVIGLDGVTFDLLGPWIEAGELPNLRRLMEQGAWGRLQTTMPPISSSSWSSFLTGVNPGKHGIFDFARRVPGTYDQELTNAARRHGRSLWRILSDAGRRVGVVNVPMTFPPEPVNGFLISGMDAPQISNAYSFPAILANDLRERFGGYRVDVSARGRQSPSPPE